MNDNYIKRLRLAVAFFLVSATYGLALRLYKISGLIELNYKNVLEGHSHTAFLGWGFLAVITLIEFTFPDNRSNYTFLKRLFIIMTLSILGMYISFPLQGYKLFSILFLSVFLLTSYIYLWKIYKLLPPKYTSTKFIKSGIFFYYLSSLAIWAIGFIVVKFGKHTLYYNTVYFYLHFLYNGFFVFALFGLFVKFLETRNIQLNKNIEYFYKLTLFACIPAYALSLLWTEMPYYVYIIAFIGGFLQVISLIYLFPVARQIFYKLKPSLFGLVFLLVIVSYYLKVIFQFLSVFPVFMKTAMELKPYFVIGYLHLYTLGFMSLFIIFLMRELAKLNFSTVAIKLIIAGIFFSELLLFGQGLILWLGGSIPFTDILLFLFSLLIPLGLLIIFLTPKTWMTEE